MPEMIIYHKGVYNLYTTVADGAGYEGGLTQDQLREVIREKYGEQGRLFLCRGGIFVSR